ncbi:hypothetical protein HF888_02835 [Bermanella marisrubri]|uniref:Uncharacterized protein n=1 Tax=Bermanella marisrubri TaxID=207949 RepID=Q1N0C4_9GAMM|nr:hypothetical protein [Bermanella marisrubri]EAT11740.1 hypothetical protein RED65_06317 [Oceanobacter sp. RED65] [Bermanella marisrubri]QIZ83228.1 hypothetical protein HF888_02835 [Bermanella marisrubri]
MTFNRLPILTIFVASANSFALEPMTDEAMTQVTGQNGVYLSGDITFNELGGPLTSTDPNNIDPDGAGPLIAVWGSCAQKAAGEVERCGARLSAKTNATEGYYVLDEMRGKLSFEGLTLKAREIDQSTDDFGGDEVAFDGKTVLEIGLPNNIRFEDFSYNLATSNTARPTDAGHQQRDLYGVEINGNIEMHGNLLLFPTGTP